MTLQKNLFGQDDFISNEQYVIISLMEEYFLNIVNGQKKYEYRRKFINRPCKAFIYVNSPVMAISGLVHLEKPIYDTVDGICRIAENQKAGSTEGMLTYLNGLERAYAIPIQSLIRFKPLRLAEIRESFPNFSPPQFYISANKKPELLRFLLDYANKNRL